MATKTLLIWQYLRTYLMVIMFFNLPDKVLAEVLIRHSEVTTEEFRNYLNINKEFTSFTEAFIAKHDYLDYATTKIFIDAEEEKDLEKQGALLNILNDKLNHTFLSNQKKALWIASLELSQKNKKIENNLGFNQQISSLQNKNSLFEHQNNIDYYRLTELNLEPDDTIFINGWAIYPNERENVFLNKSLFYHFLFLSDSKVPFIKIGIPESFNLTRDELVSGTCSKVEFHSSIEELVTNDTAALFNKNCLSNKLGQPQELTNLDLAKSINHDLSFKSNWRKSPYTYGALLFGVALLVNYSELRNYRVRIVLPF